MHVRDQLIVGKNGVVVEEPNFFTAGEDKNLVFSIQGHIRPLHWLNFTCYYCKWGKYGFIEMFAIAIDVGVC